MNIAERIEVFDREVELFGKKLGGVGHDRRAARQEQSLRRRAALLSAIKLDRLVDLNVQPRHDLARDFRNRRLLWIVRFLVRAAQTDEALFDLQPLRLRELEFGFGGKILCDRVGADVDPARIDFALLEEQQVAGLGADVQQHRASVQVAVIVAEGIAERRR